METTLVVVGVIVVLLAALFGYAATKPDTFRIQRAAAIKAPPERVFTRINDFQNWVSWSPWERMDPQLQRKYSGAAHGKGAVYEWEGNKKVGRGRMEIVEALAPAKVVIALHFIKPFEARNTAEFTLEPAGESTNVTWAMHGRQPFLMKVMTVFLNMDRMVGKDFEAGLANLKTLAER